MSPIEKEYGDRIKVKGDVVVIPYNKQGHINPSLGLAKYLASKGLLVTFIITTSVDKSAVISDFTSSSITIHTVSDGSEDIKEPETMEAYFQRFRTVFSANLAKFIDQNKNTCIIVYDSTMPWILEIAHDRGLLGAPFFTQSAAVSAVYYHLKQASLLRFPYELQHVSLPSLPPLQTGDLPSFPAFGDSEKIVMDHLALQFSNIDKADWIFSNTFHNLENQILGWIASHWPIKTVGPTFLLGQNDGEFPNNKNNNINIFEANHETYREWLDLRQAGSVVFVSIGSIASLGKEQMEELAFGLIMSDYYFLWVVRSSEVDKLPTDFTCLVSEKGLIVEWCHQQEVLAHRALACFVSHCGWNSTLEALSCGVPIVAMAQWLDQITNAKFVEDVWKFGVRVKAGENGIISREEIAKCIKEVVDGDELKANACKWKDLANEAVQKGGTSGSNIDNFVSMLK